MIDENGNVVDLIVRSRSIRRSTTWSSRSPSLEISSGVKDGVPVRYIKTLAIVP